MSKRKKAPVKKRPGIKITYLTGATKIVYYDDIDTGRSIDPQNYLQKEGIRWDMIKDTEEGEF